MRLGELVPTPGALELRPIGEIVANLDKALMIYSLGPEDLEKVYRAYGPPGYSHYRLDQDRGSAKPWPPGNPAEADRLIRQALGKVKVAGKKGKKAA